MKITSHARRHDQFYTSRPLAEDLIGRAFQGSRLPSVWIEPSAGDGSFVDALHNKGLGGQIIALDLFPARKDILRADFLQWSPPSIEGSIAVIGNPPFGKNASLAVKFFNHAAEFADTIAMIFPRTFEKHALQNRLDRRFHLVSEISIRPDSFVFEGEQVSVPCVFQVWERLSDGNLRGLHEIIRSHDDFEFVPQGKGDFAFQRVGVAAGTIKPGNAKISPESHLFIRVNDRKNVENVKSRFSSIDWSEIKHKTAGNPSIGKGEIVKAYVQKVTGLA